MNENRDLWIETYGFAHECTCATDYEAEDVGEVTMCYAKLANDSLDTCKLFRTALGRIAEMAGDSSTEHYCPSIAAYAGEFIR
jgi:hypothetical protein